jgi:spore maturation protein CgeB
MQDARLRQALTYPRFTGTPRILVFDTGYHVVADVVDGAAQLGYAVRTLPTKLRGRGEDRFIADLLTAVVVHRPDFLLTINHTGFDEQGVLAQLLHRYELPLASWFVDHPAPVLGYAPGNITDTCQVFCIERSALAWLSAQGFRDPVYLPSASNSRCFHPDRVDRPLAQSLGTPLCFVGGSWWPKAREEPLPEVQQAAQALLDGASIDKRRVREGVDRLLAAVPAHFDPRRRHDIVLVALAEAAMRERVRFGAALCGEGLRIHGDEHWRRLVPGIDLLPNLDYRRQLPAAFLGSQVNVNITAVQLATGANQRLWDVPGAGGFLLTDAQEDALEFFRDGHDVALYRDLDEARDKARHYLGHPAERQAIAARGFLRVEQAHRYPDRLRRLEGVMRARFG